MLSVTTCQRVARHCYAALCGELPACVAVRYLTLRTGCSRGRTPKVVRPQQRKNPLPFPISQRSHVGNLRQTIQGKGVIHKRVETAGVYPLVRPRGVSADSACFASAPLPMSTIIKIDKYPQKGYTNLTRGYGGIGRRARFRFWWETVQVQVLLPAVEQEKSGRQDLNLFKLLLPAVEQETERRIRREVFGFYGRFRE